jgi:hypothetical protein
MSAFGSFFSKEIKYAEAELINTAATQLSNHTTQIETLIDASAPQGVDAIVNVVENNDKALGPLVAVFVNSTLTGYKAEIETELQTLVAQGGALVPNVVTAMRNVATKLQAEAAAA